MLTPSDFNRMVHRPPISFGLSVRKELTRFLSIESGLSYTFLSSYFENKFPVQQEANLDLHYLGVPLNLIVNIYGNRYTRWNFYFSAGGMIEKGLFSHYVQTVYEEPSFAITSKSDEKIKGFQYSLQSAVGIDFKITKNYSLYLEPKITYYLSNNQPFNIRTEHPLVFGMNFGIRYNW
ncbi:MAG: PorT family protein [Dysgonamonadaceae bacterium]|nr:PorT family protein [Dysgonamonadaceae bacterium]